MKYPRYCLALFCFVLEEVCGRGWSTELMGPSQYFKNEQKPNLAHMKLYPRGFPLCNISAKIYVAVFLRIFLTTSDLFLRLQSFKVYKQ